MKITTQERERLAAMVTGAIFNFDPYNGADQEDVTTATKAELKTLAGCYEVIEQLCEMLMEV